MKKLWRNIINTGIDNSVSESDANHIRINNVIQMIVSIWLYTGILTILPKFPDTMPLVVDFAVFATLWFGVLVLNKHRKHLAAKIYNACLAVISTVTTSVLLGFASHNHLHFILVIVCIIFIFSRREKFYIYFFSAICVFCFFGLEVWFKFHGPIVRQSAHDIEVNRLITLMFLFVVVMIVSQFNKNLLKEARQKLMVEKDKVDTLLLNILPEQIANRLKNEGKSIADHYAESTVMFVKIVNFRKVSKGMTPVGMVERLDDIFSAFDAITKRHQLEKIKTIETTYMAAGGLPVPREDHCEAVADLALEFMQLCSDKYSDLEIRIGINSGPVIGGVIGKNKFAYDLWGDTVNTASRMQDQGLAGEIQVSKTVNDRLKEAYDLRYRGRINVKGKGETETWFLLSRKRKDHPSTL